MLTDPVQTDSASPDQSFYVISADAIDCPLGEGLAILDTRTNCYFSLNATGALVWGSAKTPATLAMLRKAVMAQFDCDEADCHADVQALLDALVAAGLMQLVAQSG